MAHHSFISLESDTYAYATHRVWYMPWRWRIVDVKFRGPDTIIASNLSAAEARGLLKILGVTQ